MLYVGIAGGHSSSDAQGYVFLILAVPPFRKPGSQTIQLGAGLTGRKDGEKDCNPKPASEQLMSRERSLKPKVKKHCSAVVHD